MTKFNSPFIKQTSFEVDYAPTHITKWKSQRTGLQLTYINQPSPIVNGYFAVATEISDNSGAPHTLEHLIFMGSKKFPYKGLLDNLGNRLYSSTNAWTSVDQTVYTLRTAGWEGFKTLLPIYLDHLINPTLTDEACLTEVYHIDGKGEEKGVVFSEMQGIENQSWFIVFQKMQETLYDKNSGYSSETGGLMSELRHLTNEKIREFHKLMYRPDNLCVIITGSIDQDELLEIMTEFDNELPAASTGQGICKRPFVDSKHDEPLTEVIVQEVEFPEKDETMGELLISWIGPMGNDTLTNVALDMVGAYFTDSPISIFNKHLIEIENPLATEVLYNTDDYYRTALNFNFSGVPTENLPELDNKIKQLLKEQTNPDKIELEYMKQIIEQQKLKFIASAENSASIFSNVATLEFIYGDPDGSDLYKWTKDLKEFEILMDWTRQQWSQLIDTYFVQNKSATILGKPSAELNESMKLQNKQILKDIKNKYGGDKQLANLQLKLEAAQKFNDTPIPDELVTQFPAPDPLKISFIHTKSYKAGNTKNGIVDNSTNQYIENDDISRLLAKDTPSSNDFPLFIHFEHFKSQFVTIQLVMSSKTVDPNLLSYMSIMEEIFSMSIEIPKEDGGVEYIPYEKVISDINRDLIEHELDNGFDEQFFELITIKIKFEIKNYQKAIQWLYNITNHVKFEMNRIKIIIEKIINSLPEKKRNEELMMYSSQYRHLFNENSLRKAQDSIFTESFYKNLLEKLDTQDNGFKEIEEDLNKFKQQLFQLDNIKVIILGDVTKLQNPVSSWNRFITPPQLCHTNGGIVVPFRDLPRSYQYRSLLGETCHGEAFIVNIPSADSTHLTSITKIPHGNYLDEDIFRIALATEFLTAVEGPFWRGIRGTGLAYGVHITRNIETGYLNFNIYRGSDCIQTWIKAKTIIEQFINRELIIDEISIDNAINGLINELINNHNNNHYNTAISKIGDNIFKNRGPNYIEFFIKKLNQLKQTSNYQDEIIYILKKYFIKLFDASNSTIFTSLPSDKIESVAGFFNKQGYNINVEDIGSEDYSEEEEYSGSEEDDECESD